MTMRTQPRVGYRLDQRRHILPWVARCFAQRKMLDRHIRLQRAQDEFEDEPHRAVLHVESNYRQTIPIKCEFRAPTNDNVPGLKNSSTDELTIS
jgi:hypothetical protein